MEKEVLRVSQSTVAQALAADYFCIYYVNTDNDHFIEYSSSPEYKRLGLPYKSDDFVLFSRENFEHVIHPDDRERFLAEFTKKNVMSSLDDHHTFTLTFRMMFDSVPTYVHLKVTRMIEKEGHHVVIGISSVDEQMKLEREYREKIADARISARNDFLANISHDIRTPMNAIVGYTNIAKKNAEDAEIVKDCLEKIGSSSHFLLSLINDVLDMSKIESGKMQLNVTDCDLEAILKRIEDITSLQAENKRLNITYDRKNVHHYKVRGDELRIEQSLINIVSNAIKYTPEGKDVILTATQEPGAEPGYCRYRFVIKDTGIGISEEYLPHIFDSFTREQNTLVNRIQGTGLGLAITARVVELMGGTITVRSKPGEGSEFTVVFDLEMQQENPDESGETEKAGDAEKDLSNLRGKRILLVEDNDINAEIAAMLLAQFGIETERSENGKAGLDKIREMGEGYYDAVLMDIQMPVMNGMDATRQIRQLEGAYYASLPIAAISANAYDDDVRACLEAGMNAHVAKPFNPETLAHKLLEIIKN